MSATRRLSATLVVVAIAAGCASNARLHRAEVVSGGNKQQGRTLLANVGCGACHTIPGVTGANALVGPPLNHFGSRSFVAGQLSNTPDNLTRWIMHPQQVEPGTAMPDLGVTEDQARDMVAYLESL
ncbi:MAG: Cytochrome c class [Acidimicrobiia bacterium]|nr:Cytochrome c class [Acidimicrobiia bacterium]